MEIRVSHIYQSIRRAIKLLSHLLNPSYPLCHFTLILIGGSVLSTWGRWSPHTWMSMINNLCENMPSWIAGYVEVMEENVYGEVVNYQLVIVSFAMW